MMSQIKPIHITDVVLRDGHQSLIATRLRTEHMLPICEKLDKVGYWSLEVWGGATFDACVRFLREDPWERLRALRKALPNTRLQMLLRGQNLLGYRHYADDVVEAFVERSADNGIDVFRIFDAMNDLRNLETSIRAVKQSGKHAQGAICYTTSPIHTIDNFVRLGKHLADMGSDSIVIKDMAGLLTPYVTGELVRALKAALPLPIVLHSHSTSGLAALCQWKAIESGVDHIDTAISSFGGGTSHPATETLVAALKDTPYDSGLELGLLQEIAEYFRGIRSHYQEFESEFTREDIRVQINQVPGGMMSNLASQLKEQGALYRIADVFQEIPRVRKDLGFPPLVTPTSQIVGAQAVVNVLGGGRYQTLVKEVKRYLLGHYGAAPGPISNELQRMVTADEKAIDVRPADLLPAELPTLREQIGILANDEEDVLIFAMFPDIGKAFLEQRAAGTLRSQPQPSESRPGNSEAVPGEFVIDVHGESYQVAITGVSVRDDGKRHLYLTLDGVPEEAVFEPLNVASLKTGRPRTEATAKGHVTVSMPGIIVAVLVEAGEQVQVGQPLLVTEAMKMETEVQAPIQGRIANIHVARGESVNPGEVLIEIMAE